MEFFNRLQGIATISGVIIVKFQYSNSFDHLQLVRASRKKSRPGMPNTSKPTGFEPEAAVAPEDVPDVAAALEDTEDATVAEDEAFLLIFRP